MAFLFIHARRFFQGSKTWCVNLIQGYFVVHVAISFCVWLFEMRSFEEKKDHYDLFGRSDELYRIALYYVMSGADQVQNSPVSYMFWLSAGDTGYLLILVPFPLYKVIQYLV